MVYQYCSTWNYSILFLLHVWIQTTEISLQVCLCGGAPEEGKNAFQKFSPSLKVKYPPVCKYTPPNPLAHICIPQPPIPIPNPL